MVKLNNKIEEWKVINYGWYLLMKICIKIYENFMRK